MKKGVLSEKEKQTIKVLNFILLFDGMLDNEDDVIYLLKSVINRFISKKKQHLLYLSESSYPMRIITRNIEK